MDHAGTLVLMSQAGLRSHGCWVGARRPGLPRQRPSAGAGPLRRLRRRLDLDTEQFGNAPDNLDNLTT
jgi:hypothetical protein